MTLLGRIMLDASAMLLCSKLCGHKVTYRQQFVLFAYSIDPCVDHRFDCDTQFMREECHRNPYSTIMLCPKSCGAC